MISVSQAEKIVLSQARLCAIESIPLTLAHGRVLREPLVSDRDQPAYDKSTMDGIAVSSTAFLSGNRDFVIKGIIPAGIKSPGSIKNPADCFKIMTGAVVPAGSDAVIPIEHVQINDSRAKVIRVPGLTSGLNIRFKGSDCLKGAMLVKPGTQLRPNHIATAASIGKNTIKVSKKVSIAIISTGDEIVDIHIKKIKPYQVRMSNSYALQAVISASGLGESKRFHLADHPKKIEQELSKIIKRFDMVILSGGVSMGDFDFIPLVLKKLNIKMLFHKVQQKPGKPFWFGKSPNGKIIFALPGNPASTQICAYRYVLPFLQKVSGCSRNVPFVLLDQDIELKSQLTQFLPVQIKRDVTANRLAMPVINGGSGDFASLSQTDGFIEISGERESCQKHTPVPFYSWGCHDE